MLVVSHVVRVLPFAMSFVACVWVCVAGVRGSGWEGKRQRVTGVVALLAGLTVNLLLYGAGDSWLALSFAPFVAWGVLCGVEDYCSLRVPYDSRAVNVLCGLSLLGSALSPSVGVFALLLGVAGWIVGAFLGGLRVPWLGGADALMVRYCLVVCSPLLGGAGVGVLALALLFTVTVGALESSLNDRGGVFPAGPALVVAGFVACLTHFMVAASPPRGNIQFL